MLWKQPYETRILRDLPGPVGLILSLDGSPILNGPQVWVGGFGFEAISDQGVWWRLFKSDFAGDKAIKKVFIFDGALSGHIQNAHALIPRSEADSCLLVEDGNEMWRKTVNPDGPTRGFAAIIVESTITLLMVGPPTEDAWEEFSNCWRVTRT
jgi:hypothetical protein